MQRTTVLLLFGGESSEHDVSISSARNVYAAINDTLYDVQLCFIDRQGKWWLIDEFDEYNDLESARRLSADMGAAAFVADDEMVVAPDVLLPVLHGKNGEDGSVQGLAQLLHIPIVGCDMTSSVLAMDKIATKDILSNYGIAVVPYQTHQQDEPLPIYDTLRTQLGDILFVKPARAGSSVGVARVSSAAELDTAIMTAHEHDEFVLIEQAVMSARELEVAILGTPPHHQASVVGEIRPDGEFYSYDSKYSGTSQSALVIPAELDTAFTETVRTQALAAYAALKCRGLARVDFLLSSEGTLYLNEVNTLPGFTNISMYPKLWRASGVPYGQLVDRLLSAALQ